MNKAFKRYGKKRYKDTPLSIIIAKMRWDAMQSCHSVINRRGDDGYTVSATSEGLTITDCWAFDSAELVPDRKSVV